MGSFTDNVLFPSSGTSECTEGRRYGVHWLILQALEKSERQPEWWALPESIGVSKDILLLHFRLLPPRRGLLRGFAGVRNRSERQGPQNRSTTPPPAEAKKGEKLHGVSSQACQAGPAPQSPTQNVRLLFTHTRHGWQPASAGNTACPSAAPFS